MRLTRAFRAATLLMVWLVGTVTFAAGSAETVSRGAAQFSAAGGVLESTEFRQTGVEQPDERLDSSDDSWRTAFALSSRALPQQSQASVSTSFLGASSTACALASQFTRGP